VLIDVRVSGGLDAERRGQRFEAEWLGEQLEFTGLEAGGGLDLAGRQQDRQMRAAPGCARPRVLSANWSEA
jgi:hypothetical protein